MLSAFSEANVPSFLNLEQNNSYQQSDQFLKNLGFEDFVGEIQKTLDSHEKISDVSKLALEKSKDYLQSFNSSRDLADLMYSILNSSFNKKIFENSIKRDLILKMTIQQLKSFPLLSLEPLAFDQIEKIKKLQMSEGMQIKRNILTARAQDRFFREKMNLIKAFLVLIEPKEKDKDQVVDWLDSKLTDSLADAYTIEKRQQNRLLGRAFIVTIIHFLREQNDEKTEKWIKQELMNEGLFLENYILGYSVSDVGKNDLRANALESGDIALEYSHGQEAFFTSLLIQPQDSENKNLAQSYKLNNQFLDFYHFLDDKKYYEVLDKKDTYKSLTKDEEKLYQNFWDKKYANGFSHAGIVEVKKDHKSQIAVAWIWDIYPEKDKIGVVRVLTPEGFSYPEKMLKLAFLRYSPEKILASFKSQISQRGYLKNIWNGYSSFAGKYASGEYGPSIDKDESYAWPTKVDEASVMKWTQVKSSEAQVWYQKEILPRVFSRIKKYLVSSEAKVFADGLVSAKDMLYCSQMITMAFLEEVNFDLQNSQDHVWESLKYLSGSIREVLKINIVHRLVSPNGLVWQSDIFLNLYTTFHNRDRVSLQQNQLNPTVAENYTSFLDEFFKNKNVQIKEDDLLSLKANSIELDLEN